MVVHVAQGVRIHFAMEGTLVQSLVCSVQFSNSVVSDSLRPCGLQHARPSCPSPTPGVTQTHVHWVGDAIQPSHPLLSPSPPAFNLSQHQGLFQGVSSSHQVAKVLEFHSASVLPMNIQDWFPLGWTGWLSLLSKGLSRVFSNTTVQKHQLGITNKIPYASRCNYWTHKSQPESLCASTNDPTWCSEEPVSRN